MKTSPILYSTLMVQALLAGTKNQTRRTIDIDPERYSFKTLQNTHRLWDSSREENPGIIATHAVFVDGDNNELLKKCKYSVGDVMWVRESFAQKKCPISGQEQYSGPGEYRYKSDWTDIGVYWKWKPSIHMPKSAARLFYKITNIRVERLHDISAEDAVAEGIIVIEPDEAYYDYEGCPGSFAGPRGSYFSLWTSINGRDSFNANPYVWVYDFERVERPSDFLES